MSTIKINTNTCLHCGEQGFIEMSKSEYDQGLTAYNEGALIQCAFPGLSAGQREQIISGTHPKCWNEMMTLAENFGMKEENNENNF